MPAAAGRAGWVGTRNFEVDSGAYFLSLLFNFHSTFGRARAADTLTCPEVRRAHTQVFVKCAVKLLLTGLKDFPAASDAKD